MQQVWRKATKYVVSDGILYWMRKTNELLAKVLVSTKQNSKAMEAADERSGHRG